MSIWGKLIGGTAGFALGGPLGAILGAAAGHGVDKASNYKTSGANKNYEIQDKEKIFATGVISLAAKIAKADGRVTADEIQKFKKIFEFPKEDEKNISELFNAAKEDIFDYDIIAKQLYEVFVDDKKLLIEIMNSLFAIAYADGVFHEKEEKILLEITKIFKIDYQEYESIKNIYTKKSNEIIKKYTVCCKILGVSEKSTMNEITLQYRKLVKDYHPDRLQGLGLPEDFIKLANNRLSEINEAYTFLKNENTK